MFLTKEIENVRERRDERKRKEKKSFLTSELSIV